MEKELKTDKIMIKVEPSVKASAKRLAEKDGRTLSNYIVELLKREIANE